MTSLFGPRFLLVTICALHIFPLLMYCSPPEKPIKCASKNSNCTVANSYGSFTDRSACHAAAVAYPSSEQELVSIVANATVNNRKVKVATRYSHSIPKLVCVDGPDGLLISTNHLNRTLGFDAGELTMTVESGVTLRQLIDEAAKAGMALPYAPYWWGLTVGGLLATGAHGSSLWGKGSAVHDHVIGIRIVTPATAGEGYAKVRQLGEGDEDFKAVKISLGVLGVISQVTFKLQPMFKRSITYVTKTDTNLGNQVVSFGQQHEFGDITWYPSQHKVVYRIDDRVPSTISGNGLYDIIAFRSTLSIALALIRSAEEDQESKGSGNGKCVHGKALTFALQLGAFGLTNNGIIFSGYPVIGYQNRLQSSGTCLDSLENFQITACPWDPRVKSEFFFQTTFSISLVKLKSFIEDVQRLVLLEPQALCGLDLYNGILMRYVKASDAYLGKQEDAVDFDLTYYRSKDPMTPRLYEDVFEEIEQMAVFKYGALPHWGKNRNVAFKGAIHKYKHSGEFLKVKERYDPQGLFSNEWTDQILGLNKNGVDVVTEGCALEGLCICSKDANCAPNKGYYCRPGRIYKDAKVCTRSNNY